MSFSSVVFSLGYAKTSYINQNESQEPIDLEPALILALTKIWPRIKTLLCQK
jgi:hypothetical protein